MVYGLRIQPQRRIHGESLEAVFVLVFRVEVWVLVHEAIHGADRPDHLSVNRGGATSAGPVVIPQLLLTTTGRKSGQPRIVQLAYTEIDGRLHLVASNFGGQKHPGWSYNLGANPSAEVQLGARKFPVAARQLNDEEKARVWGQLVANIPNYDIYKTRTDRNIKVYRLDEAG